MQRVRTQEDFIAKANEIHGNYYDYSQTQYVKSSEKVKIICPIHGVFEQTPNKHLAGQGCKQCGRDRTKIGFDEFVARARAVHGDKYDYSKVVYRRKDVDVCIVCPEHGEFMQSPHSHIILKHQCPKCAARAGGGKRRGNVNAMSEQNGSKKRYKTCLERYGARTWAQSEEGRKRLHDIVTSPEVAEKMRDTCMQRYGAKTWPESETGKDQLHQIMSSDEMQAKIVAGYRAAYGVDHFMKTDKGRQGAREHIMTDSRQAALRDGFMRAYGVPNALLLKDVQMKIRQAIREKYGVDHVSQLPEVLAKGWATRRKNGTFNSSKPEETLYRLLCDVFGVDDVIRQYVDEDRYSFHCDFYVASLDLFIELNASWAHGGHWFDPDNLDDLAKLAEWQDRAKKKGSRYIRSAITVWTERDPMKLSYALEHHLNYLVFWDNNLADARAWLASFERV